MYGIAQGPPTVEQNSGETGKSTSGTKAEGNAEPKGISDKVEINRAIQAKIKTTSSSLTAELKLGSNSFSEEDLLAAETEIETSINNNYKGKYSEIEVKIDIVVETDPTKADIFMGTCASRAGGCWTVSSGNAAGLYDSSTPNTFYVDELLKRDGTIAHEFGHLLGFDHTSNVENSIMSYAKERVGITDAKGFNVWAKYRNPRG